MLRWIQGVSIPAVRTISSTVEMISGIRMLVNLLVQCQTKGTRKMSAVCRGQLRSFYVKQHGPCHLLKSTI